MSELNKIQAPVLNGAYGKNIKETFDKIDANFGVLSNRNLWKGDPGRSLVSINIPWSVLLSDPTAESIEYPVGSGLKFKNYYNGIREAFRKISENTTDLDAVISQLISTSTEHILGLGDTIVASFTEPEDGHEDEIIEFKTITPYVYVDERFRALSGDLSDLANCTDMSCVISMDYIEDENNDSQYRFICTQSFPTLYFNINAEGEGALYWIINGSRTQIPARGPKGIDGTTGNFYIGIAADVTEDDQRNANAWTNLDTNPPVNIYISYVLVPGLDADKISQISDKSRIPFVNLDNGDYEIVTGTKYPTSGAPIIVLKTIPDDYDFSTNPLVPYYIAATAEGQNGLFAVVSTYNICYAYLTNTAVKSAIMTNVRMINRTGDPWGGSGSIDWIPAYPIRTGGTGSEGYATWVQPSLEHESDPSNPVDPEFTIGYVSNVKRPSIYSVSDGEGNFSGSFVIAGRVSSGYKSRATGYLAHAEGYMTSASGKSAHSEGSMSHAEGEQSHAEGKGSHASGLASHAEGYSTTAGGSSSHAEGQGTTASGKYSHTEGYFTTVIADGGHAEGYYTRGFGKYSHAEGASSTASGDYSHAEGMSTVAAGISISAHMTVTTDSLRAICSLSLSQPEHGYASVFQGINTFAVKKENDTKDDLHVSSISTADDKIVITCTSYQIKNYSSYWNNVDVQLIIPYSNSWWTSSKVDTLLNNSTTYPAHAEGWNTKAYGKHSHVEGYETIAYGEGAHVEGYKTRAEGIYSHAEGYVYPDGVAGEIVAKGTASHAEGYANYGFTMTHGPVTSIYYPGKIYAYGEGAHAEGFAQNSTDVQSSLKAGNYLVASGSGAHAEGVNTKALNYGAHSEGYRTVSEGSGSHTEGYITSASGEGSHAEGYYTMASGTGAHAEGYYTVASGSGSHAEGSHTRTSRTGEHACGIYNKTGEMYLYTSSGEVYGVIFGPGEEPNDHIPSGSNAGHMVVFSIGIGTGEDEDTHPGYNDGNFKEHRFNAFCVTKQDGNDFVYHGWKPVTKLYNIEMTLDGHSKTGIKYGYVQIF